MHLIRSNEGKNLVVRMRTQWDRCPPLVHGVYCTEETGRETWVLIPLHCQRRGQSLYLLPILHFSIATNMEMPRVFPKIIQPTVRLIIVTKMEALGWKGVQKEALSSSKNQKGHESKHVSGARNSINS